VITDEYIIRPGICPELKQKFPEDSDFLCDVLANRQGGNVRSRQGAQLKKGEGDNWTIRQSVEENGL
jgi:hypothetical protein